MSKRIKKLSIRSKRKGQKPYANISLKIKIINLKVKTTMYAKYIILTYSNFDYSKRIKIIWLLKISSFCFTFDILYNQKGNESNNYNKFCKKKKRTKKKYNILQIW